MSCVTERGNFPEFKGRRPLVCPDGGLSVFQVEDRRSGIGGTDAKRIMEGDWRSLWAEKTGRAEPQDLYDRLDPVKDRFILKNVTRDSLELARLMGHATEALNAFWFEYQTGRAVTRRNELVKHPTIPFMFANIDGMTVTAKLKALPCVWDAKCVNKLDDRVVERNTPQLVHNALAVGAEHWCQSFLIGNSKWDKAEQEVDPFYAADLLAKEAEFWGYVTRDEEPEDGAALPPPKPVKLREVSLEDGIAWPNWGSVMVERLGEYGNVLAPWTRGNILRDEIKKLLPEDVGLVTRGRWKVARNRAGAITIGVTKGASDAAA